MNQMPTNTNTEHRFFFLLHQSQVGYCSGVLISCWVVSPVYLSESADPGGGHSEQIVQTDTNGYPSISNISVFYHIGCFLFNMLICFMVNWCVGTIWCAKAFFYLMSITAWIFSHIMKLTLDLAFDLDNTINQNDCNLITSLKRDFDT